MVYNTDEDQSLGDSLYRKIELILPGKIKRCQRIIGIFLDYSDRTIIEKSLKDDDLFNHLVNEAIKCIEQNKQKNNST